MKSSAAKAHDEPAAPEPASTASIETRSAEPEPPAVPAPTIIQTVTYDFTAGTKRTVLHDGTVYQETFDPKMFHKVPAPRDSGSSLSAHPAGEGQAQIQSYAAPGAP
jgi:hypothetical protein